jgi:hypothetical protein
MMNVEWRKSTYSTDQGNCVEAASVPDAIAIRDSKNPNGPNLAFAPESWEAYTSHVKASQTG